MTAELLPDDVRDAIRERASGHDRDNTFFDDDLAALSASGYLRAFVPASLGGPGLDLGAVAHLQARLAAAAPATALAINMHLVWTGVARILHDSGDHSLDGVLREAQDGEVFAFGISEAGNDLVLFDAATEARPDGDGGYSFYGRKIFTSLSPAWTRLGVTGLELGPDGERSIVYAFLRRGPGVDTLDDWDTVGMRASQSRTTVLDGAHAPADAVARRIPAGPNGDPIVFAIFAAFELLLSAVYTGIAERALELAVSAARARTSRRTGAAYASDPDIRWRIADAAIALDALWPQIDTLASDVTAGVDHGGAWFARLSSMKHRATETARVVVDQAIRVAGGSSYFSSNELGRLYRDVLAGIFHPSDAESVHSTVAQSLLGPVPDAV